MTYQTDKLDLGRPLRFSVDSLRFRKDSAAEDLSAYTVRLVIKDSLNSATRIKQLDSSLPADEPKFDVVGNWLYIEALTATESEQLEQQITPEESELYIDEKQVLGYIYVTISATANNFGPETLAHVKVSVLKPAI